LTAFLDLFSGIGGFALAAYWSGLRFDKHYFSEVDDYAVKLYQKRFTEAIPLGDIRNADYSKLPEGEYLAAGGFPCQPHSIAGKRKGSGDERDLWSECFRALRELRPRIALFENVPELLISDNGQYFNRVLSDIHQSGYDAEWQIISASGVGAPHRRKRLWIAAYPESERCQAHRQNIKSNKKGCAKKPAEWKPLQSVAARNYIIQHWKDHEQILTGTYDGLPEELDAIKCAGNAVVPHCAEMIFNIPAFDYWRKGEIE